MAVDADRQYILIVEDDEDLAEGICLSLKKGGSGVRDRRHSF